MSRSVQALGLLLAASLLAGCAERPRGTLLASAEAVAPGTSRVDMLVATTRSADGTMPGELFSGERGRKLAFADIAISIPPDSARVIGEVQLPGTTPDPRREFVALSAERLDQSEAVKRFAKRLALTPKRHVLLFVHGYNTRFEEAVYRFAQIVHDSRAEVLPVLFTWPSRGKLLAYTYDRESANYSRDALESVLQTLARDKSVGEISILAHSMGNWVTLEALRQMAIRDKAIAPKIRNVMLAAPDVDFDVFRRQIAEIGVHNAPFTLFVSRDDSALAISSKLWGNAARVGSIDPQAEPYRSDLAQSKLKVYDLSDVKTGDATGHAKFAESPEVVQMIGRRLASGQTLSDSQAGLGDRIGQVAIGATSAVGRAASIVVSAPIAIIDPRTRESLGDQVDDLGGHVGGTFRSASDVAQQSPR